MILNSILAYYENSGNSVSIEFNAYSFEILSHCVAGAGPIETLAIGSRLGVGMKGGSRHDREFCDADNPVHPRRDLGHSEIRGGVGIFGLLI